jgi:hypothetical protein
MTMNQGRDYRRICPPAALILAFHCLPAAAVDFKMGDDVDAKFNATLTAGTMIRTESPDPGVYGAKAGPLVGLPAGLLGANGGNSDLNFKKNRPVSTVIKAVADFEVRRNDFGFFVRAMAWDDTELKNGDRAYGNVPNGFKQNAPLSDTGFAPESKFSNAQITGAYVFGKANLSDDSSLSGRVGRQVVSWGVSQFTGGGVNVINPDNLPAQQRPGALPEEAKVPVGMVYMDLAGGKQWGVEGFLQWEYRPTALPGCGTFFMTPNYLPTGCNYVSVLPNLTDPVALSTGRFPHRNPDIDAKDSGQFGLSFRYNADALSTQFRGYLMNYHSRTPSIRATNANVAGTYGTFNPATNALTRLTDPNGAKYGLIYAENIHLAGFSFVTRPNPTLRIYGELAYRPNQPLNINSSDLIAALAQRSPTSVLNLAKNINAIPPGGSFDAYDRYKVTTVTIGTSKLFANTWGAEQVTLAGEIGLSHVSGLPDPGVLRYGRSELYGIAAINGQTCTDNTVAKKSCAHNGFITSSAAGVRLRLSAVYPGAFFGATLRPTLGIGQDISGYSYDGSFVKDRSTIIAAIRAEWAKKYYADVQYTRYSGAKYYTLIDRDNVSLVAGVRF